MKNTSNKEQNFILTVEEVKSKIEGEREGRERDRSEKREIKRKMR